MNLRLMTYMHRLLVVERLPCTMKAYQVKRVLVPYPQEWLPTREESS